MDTRQQQEFNKWVDISESTDNTEAKEAAADFMHGLSQGEANVEESRKERHRIGWILSGTMVRFKKEPPMGSAPATPQIT